MKRFGLVFCHHQNVIRVGKWSKKEDIKFEGQTQSKVK